jgi:hypothetical protein
MKLLLLLLALAATGGAYSAFQQISRQEADDRQKVNRLASEVDQVTTENKKLAGDYDQLSQGVLLTRHQMDDLALKLRVCRQLVKQAQPPPSAPIPAPVRPAAPAPVAMAPAPALSDLVMPPDSFNPDEDVPPGLSAKWRDIRKAAKEFVDKESPPSVWPFERLSPQARAQSPSKVFSHYFLPFPLSFNQPVDHDYYQNGYISPDGEGGKHRASGGFLRERPLSPPPWDSPDWVEINFAVDILRAQRMGIDGFACDLLTVSHNGMWDSMNKLFETAANVAPDFRIMLMPDMEAELSKHPEMLQKALSELARQPSVFKLADGRLVVAPFDPQRQPPEYWKDTFKQLQDEGVTVAFLPVFQGWRRYASDYESLCYGISDWGQRDVAAADGMANDPSAAASYARVWMMPVAPQDMRPKDLIFQEAGNTRAFRSLWGTAIHSRSALVQLITWNDYSESTEISPSSGTQFLFYDLGAYYTAWLKTGEPPHIVSDAIYYCHRSQILPLVAPPAGQSKPFRDVAGTPVSNQIEMIAFLTADATLEIDLNGKVNTKSASAGLATFSIPAEVGQPDFKIVREGQTVTEVLSAWPIVDHADIEDPLYRGGSSNRPFVKTGRSSNP